MKQTKALTIEDVIKLFTPEGKRWDTLRLVVEAIAEGQPFFVVSYETYLLYEPSTKKFYRVTERDVELSEGVPIIYDS